MADKRLGARSVCFAKPPHIAGYAAIGGKKEGEGPLGNRFDRVVMDTHFGQDSWELAESEMQRETIELAASKAGREVDCCDVILAGDLLNQCIGSSIASRETNVPYLGQYGACSTMAQSLLLGAMLVDGGFVDTAICAASSHFCSAERQYRFPLAYGGQRTPTAQWTATAAGAVVLSNGPDDGKLVVTAGSIGQLVDMGVMDANNMGAAMAPAAHRTLLDFWRDTGTTPQDYDLVVTGDLAEVGGSLLLRLLREDGVEASAVYKDCGVLLYSKKQDVHAGGSGCGCSAAVLCTELLNSLSDGRMHRILFTATGAMMSPTSVQQGQGIIGICHAVVIERQEG